MTRPALDLGVVEAVGVFDGGLTTCSLCARTVPASKTANRRRNQPAKLSGTPISCIEFKMKQPPRGQSPESLKASLTA